MHDNETHHNMLHEIRQNPPLPPILAIDRARIDTLNLNYKFIRVLHARI